MPASSQNQGCQPRFSEPNQKSFVAPAGCRCCTSRRNLPSTDICQAVSSRYNKDLMHPCAVLPLLRGLTGVHRVTIWGITTMTGLWAEFQQWQTLIAGFLIVVAIAIAYVGALVSASRQAAAVRLVTDQQVATTRRATDQLVMAIRRATDQHPIKRLRKRHCPMIECEQCSRSLRASSMSTIRAPKRSMAWRR